MATKSERMDYGGLDFVVRKLEVGAEKPGHPGNVVIEATEVEAVGDQTEGTHVLPIKIGGVTYYILLSDDNSTSGD